MITRIAEQITVRSATMDDIPAVTVLNNICAEQFEGGPATTEAELRASWERPHITPETDFFLAFTPDEELVGFAGVSAMPPYVQLWSWARVHPDHRGEGIGTRLLALTEERARQTLDQSPPDARVVIVRTENTRNQAAKPVLEAHGYHISRHFWRMAIDLHNNLPAPQWADGITVRTFNRERDFMGLFYADREAFSDHYGYVDYPEDDMIEQWNHWIDHNANYDPSLWFLAMDGDEIAGFCLCEPKITEDPQMGYVGDLAVRREWRRRGIGLALLHHAFRVFHTRGQLRASLHVDAASLTGATRLYERAGMHVDRHYQEFTKELRAGEDLSTQTLEEN